MAHGEAFVVTFGTTKMPVLSVHNWDTLLTVIIYTNYYYTQLKCLTEDTKDKLLRPACTVCVHVLVYGFRWRSCAYFVKHSSDLILKTGLVYCTYT